VRLNVFIFFFFFSSRRRHTRLQGDWSSDVCSSDLVSFGGISRRQTYSRSKGARQRRGEMAIDSIKSVAVLGAGTMGNGIAQVFARAGYQVILRDVEQRFLDRALETIAKNLDREIKKGKLPE